jgi:hypothetical protein
VEDPTMRILTETTCRHGSCGCRPDPELAPYCSAYCGNLVQAQRRPAEGETEGACACGHPECTRRLRDDSQDVSGSLVIRERYDA